MVGFGAGLVVRQILNTGSELPPLELPEEPPRPVEKWPREDAEAKMRLGVVTPQPRIEPAALPVEEQRGNFKEIMLPYSTKP